MNNGKVQSRNAVAIIIFITVLITLVTEQAFSDSWILPPKSRQFYSSDKSCYFEVILHLKFNDVGKDIGSYSSGSLYSVASDGQYYKKWTIRLVNELTPVNAIVSNNGYVITFDNHHSMGYGPNVVVIYGPEGNLIKNFALQDIASKWNISRMVHTVSSIVWNGDHYIDDGNDLLVLKVVSKGTWPVQKGTKYHEVKINLKHGDIIRWWKFW